MFRLGVSQVLRVGVVSREARDSLSKHSQLSMGAQYVCQQMFFQISPNCAIDSAISHFVDFNKHTEN